jgi:hypothetical protein
MPDTTTLPLLPHQPAPGRTSRALNWVDGLTPWRFTAVLYLTRWPVVLPLGFALNLLGCTSGRIAPGPAGLELIIGVVLDPLVETLVECALPYWLMRKTRQTPSPGRWWSFILTSAVIMTVLHVGAWPGAILPSMVTGIFLAYTYGHFAATRPGRALLHTWAFHACINIVGFSMMLF